MEWLTVTEVSEKIGIPVETIRRYITRHKLHLYVRKEHKSYQIADMSLDVLREIRRLYSEGKSSEEVDHVLAGGNRPTIVDIQDSVNDQSLILTVKSLDEKMNMIATMLMNLDERLKANEAFRSEVKDELIEVHKQVEVMNKEVAAASKVIIDDMSKFKHDMDSKMDEVLSRVETHGKKKKWLGLF